MTTDIRIVRPGRARIDLSKVWHLCVREWPVWVFLLCGGTIILLVGISTTPAALPAAFFMVQLVLTLLTGSGQDQG